MKQYLDLVKKIKAEGTYKEPARENMPGTTSLFGYQMRFSLQEGFPAITTKQLYWKAVVVELLWFLRGDTNIKYLVDNGCNIWNQDAYNYYCKQVKIHNNNINQFRKDNGESDMVIMPFKNFIELIKDPSNPTKEFPIGWGGDNIKNYTLGDCGHQYGKVWRDLEKINFANDTIDLIDNNHFIGEYKIDKIDQIKNVIQSLKTNPESRRHIVNAIDVVHDQDLALYWCHTMFQFNCRQISDIGRYEKFIPEEVCLNDNLEDIMKVYNQPKYYLDCQLYQRSGDVFLGVPFNIASYALLTHIIAKICNMVPGEFIHTFGDVHIYDNHLEAVEKQLQNEPKKLPTLKINSIEFDYLHAGEDFDNFIAKLSYTDFVLENYEHCGKIEGKLSTGMKS